MGTLGGVSSGSGDTGSPRRSGEHILWFIFMWTFFFFELHLKVSLGAVLEKDVLVGFVFEPVIEVDDAFVGERLMDFNLVEELALGEEVLFICLGFRVCFWGWPWLHMCFRSRHCGRGSSWSRSRGLLPLFWGTFFYFDLSTDGFDGFPYVLWFFFLLFLTFIHYYYYIYLSSSIIAASTFPHGLPSWRKNCDMRTRPPCKTCSGTTPSATATNAKNTTSCPCTSESQTLSSTTCKTSLSSTSTSSYYRNPKVDLWTVPWL